MRRNTNVDLERILRKDLRRGYIYLAGASVCIFVMTYFALHVDESPLSRSISVAAITLFFITLPINGTIVKGIRESLQRMRRW